MNYHRIKFDYINLSLLKIYTFSFFIFVLFFIINFLFYQYLEKIEENASIIVILKKEIKNEDIPKIQHQIKNIKFVRDIIYFSSEEILDNLLNEFSELNQIVINLSENPLKPYIKIFIKSFNKDKYNYVENKLKQIDLIEKIIYEKEIVKQIDNYINFLKIFLFVIIVIIICFILFIGINTFDSVLKNKIEDIKTQILLGASKYFIKKQIYFLSIINAIISAFLNFLILFLINIFIIGKIKELKFINLKQFLFNPEWIIKYLIISIIFGWLCAFINSQQIKYK
ncbi:MAG TPA: permease-like cell division protein FtsX [bacterium]|nr:permease-like cell division protein FtsX [bacterium]HOL47253.1 permease-like cell division protein FtsX [bacterium]HPQ19289.1 permease-like cell division protein FtsX [bacterium]